MILQFKNLKRGKNAFGGEITAELLNWKAPLPPLMDNVRVKAVAEKKTKVIILNLQISFRLQLLCSRCLEKHAAAFNEQSTYFIRFGQEEILPEKRLSDEDVVTIWTLDEELDLTPLARESILLALPMKPLCSSDCKGLCPICGANLNRESCEHTKEELIFKVTKLSALKDLLKGG